MTSSNNYSHMHETVDIMKIADLMISNGNLDKKYETIQLESFQTFNNKTFVFNEFKNKQIKKWQSTIINGIVQIKGLKKSNQNLLILLSKKNIIIINLENDIIQLEAEQVTLQRKVSNLMNIIESQKTEILKLKQEIDSLNNDKVEYQKNEGF